MSRGLVMRSELGLYGSCHTHRAPAHRPYGDGHSRVRGPPSVRNAEICSDTSPTRNTTTENRIRSTAPLGIREWSATFHTPYDTPSRNAAAAIGRNTRSGLK